MASIFHFAQYKMLDFPFLLILVLGHVDGRGAINPKGLQFYNDVINQLVKEGVTQHLFRAYVCHCLTESSFPNPCAGIQIHVVMYHLDLPQILEDEYGGWLSPRIV